MQWNLTIISRLYREGLFRINEGERVHRVHTALLPATILESQRSVIETHKTPNTCDWESTDLDMQYAQRTTEHKNEATKSIDV